jgi:hypothetical protein
VSVTAPFVGLPTTGTGCAYGSALDSPICSSPAEVHVIVADGAWGVAGLASCGDHAHFARAMAKVLDEHPYAGSCESPGCTWPAGD